MKKAFLTAGFIMLAFAACNNEEEEKGGGNTGYVDPDGRSITISTITPTVLTVTVDGTVTGLEQPDFIQGQFGIIYCPENKEAADLFQEWVSTGALKDNSLKMSSRTKKSNDGSLSSLIEGLEPNTSYSACLYYKPSTGKKRLISSAFTFRTKTFDIQAITEDISEKKYYSATLNGVLKGLEPADAKSCRIGFILSEEENPTIENGTLLEIEKSDDNCISYQLKNLRPSAQYHYRIFIQPLGQDDYVYGNNVAFRTRNTDDMAIDLGLSVEWSTMLLGAEEPEGRGNMYFWGDINPATGSSTAVSTETGLNTLYYDNVTMTGNYDFSISGSQYDAATYTLGEGWRMPTKAEFEELLNNCSIGAIIDPNAEVSTVSGSHNGVKFGPITTHYSDDNKLKINRNGRSIILPTCDYGSMIQKENGGYSFTRVGRYSILGLWAGDVNTDEYRDGPSLYVAEWISEPELYEVLYGRNTLEPYIMSTAYAFSILPVRDKK